MLSIDCGVLVDATGLTYIVWYGGTYHDILFTCGVLIDAMQRTLWYDTNLCFMKIICFWWAF